MAGENASKRRIAMACVRKGMGHRFFMSTNKVAHCEVCGVQWEVKSPNNDDAKGCSFCGAPESAITIENEE